MTRAELAAQRRIEELERENARLLAETTEALAQQTAVSDVLASIGRSASDLGGVLQTIVERAADLARADLATLYRLDGSELVVAATYAADGGELIAIGRRLPIGGPALVARAVTTLEAQDAPDILLDPFLAQPQPGSRTRFAVPIHRERAPLGVLLVSRRDPDPFSERQRALVQTFADQAAIAIENVRLFNETKEALERQTAISDILRVISSSPSDVQPVLDAIAASAARFCVAEDATVLLLRGSELQAEAHHGALPTTIERPDGTVPRGLPADRSTVAGTALVERRAMQFDDILAEEASYAITAARAREFGWRSMAVAPLVHDDRGLGVILLRRAEVRPFTPKQVELLRTFADQAVIAIENVRLFNETKEALDQQTAMSDVLASISSSVFDLGTVLRTIAERALALCRADQSNLYRVLDEDRIELLVRAGSGGVPGQIDQGQMLDRRGPTLAARSTRSLETLHVADARDHPELPQHDILARLAVPIVRDGTAVGTMMLGRLAAGSFSEREIQLVQTFAQQAGIAIENVRLFTETKEALERQTAISEILRLISESPDDVQPVLDGIARSAVRFCAAEDVIVVLRRDDQLQVVAHAGPLPSEAVPFPLDRGSVSGAAILEGCVVHAADVTRDDAYPVSRRMSEEIDGQRTVLAAPLLREEVAVGAIVLRRREARTFSDDQVELVRVFADQAAIAIQNVRLFNETKEALAQQTAVSDVLATISRSAFDLPSVLNTIAERASDLAAADVSAIFRLEGADLVVAAVHSGDGGSGGLRVGTRIPADGPTLAARAVRTLEAHYIDDVRGDPSLPQGGTRTRFAAPIMWEGKALGAMLVTRMAPEPFSERQRALTETFADQAAIAIENVRLFNETKEALDQQTATGQVLQSISRAAFDLQVVLDTVVERAAQLCGAEQAWMRRLDGGEFRFVAYYGASDDLRAMFEDIRSGRVRDDRRVDSSGMGGRAVSARKPVHIHDIAADPQLREGSLAKRGGARTALAVPMLRDGEPIGAIVVARNRVAPFSEREIRLVETFSDQAVIAIENVRLFNETKEALERQTAIADILRVISGSPTDVQPVLDAIADSAMRFCAAQHAIVNLIDRSLVRPVAGHFTVTEPFALDRSTVTGRSMVDVRTYAIRDLADPAQAAEFPLGHSQALISGERAIVATPMVRDGRSIGGIVLWRIEPHAFTDRQVQLVETFAAQAVIAIENVRLFNETKEALDQQTAVAGVLQSMSRSAFDLQRVLETLVEQAARLCDAERGSIHQLEGDAYRTTAFWGEISQEYKRIALDTLRRPGRETLIGRTALEGRVVHIPDVLADPEYAAHDIQRVGGYRTMLGVPLLREGTPIGVFVLTREAVRPFSDRQIALVQTFADQAVIAIENIRLFEEIRDKSQQLEVASRHKSEFLANMSHELRTPLNAIIGFSEVLIQGMFGELNAKQREYLEDVLSSGRHLLSLINDILDLAKIEAGRVELELAEFSLPAALENGMTMVRERAARQGIRLDLEVREVDRIVADERKVKQVVFNLLSNAVKFTPEGGRVAVRAETHNGEVHVAVRDTGIGIDLADRERIFEEFQQAGRDPDRSREGTGLGLSLSRRYVELHGGRIWVESEPGKGSTFTFALPLRKEG